MNPLISRGNNPTQQGTPMEMLMNVLGNGANPQQLAQNIIANNPRAVQEVQRMQQQCGNQNPRDFILNYFNQNGGNMQEIMQVANMLGLK